MLSLFLAFKAAALSVIPTPISGLGLVDLVLVEEVGDGLDEVLGEAAPVRGRGVAAFGALLASEEGSAGSAGGVAVFALENLKEWGYLVANWT